MVEPIPIAILGASGYTGADLVRILDAHKEVAIAALGAHSSADMELAQVFSHFRGRELPKLQKPENIDYTDIKAVFCALPHAASQDIIAALPEHLRIIDLSADFRLRDPKIYQEWYGVPHKATALQGEAVYGLTEIYRKDIGSARLVACPGCYPTAALLALVPLLKQGIVSADDIIIDAKSGVSGAGRAAKTATLFCEIGESLKAYSLGQHRHMPEIEQELSLAHGTEIRIGFSPHLVPMSRGEYLTIYARSDEGGDAVRARLAETYQAEAFVYVCKDGEIPSTADVRGSNLCHLAVVEDRLPGRLIIISAIDNLVKGSSGQAVQNFNVMFGLDEAMGLEGVALFP